MAIRDAFDLREKFVHTFFNLKTELYVGDFKVI